MGERNAVDVETADRYRQPVPLRECSLAAKAAVSKTVIPSSSLGSPANYLDDQRFMP